MIITYIKPSSGENELYIGGSDGENYRITVADAKRAGIFKYVENPEFLPDEVDSEMLEFMSKKLSCIKYAEYLLEFGDKSKKNLIFKLKTKGYEQDICEAAVAVLEKAGVIDDERVCTSKLHSLAYSKMFGPYRIKTELIKKGFDSKQIDIAMDEADIDYDEQIILLVEKLTSKNKPHNEKELVALKNKLIRYGYSYDSVAYALEKMNFEVTE